MKNFQVAIDGPAGSGKSSISNIISSDLGFTHLDTGAMYRAVCLEAINRNINLEDENEYSFVRDIDIKYQGTSTYLNGKDVSFEIRKPYISANVSTVSKFKIVREKMVEFQRESASCGLVLMDGRDIGSVVLPNAQVKIFLTASPETRAKRRMLELEQNGEKVDYNSILDSIIERDRKDSTREISPLVKSPDAILVDTSNMSIKEVCDTIKNIIKKRMNEMEKNEFETKFYKVGDEITGNVISVSEKSISLDINTWTEGTMYLDYYTLDKNITSFKGLVNIGDVIDCKITKISEEQILLSRLGNAKKEAFKEFGVKNVDKPITVTIKKKVNKGYMTSYQNVDFFLPEGDLVTNAKAGDKVKVLVLRVDEDKNSGLVSERAYKKAVLEETKAKEYGNLKVGDTISGVISKIQPYGVFVSFGNLQGLVRTKEISHVFVNNINDVIKVDDKVNAKIINLENGKIELSIKALVLSPIQEFALKNKVSDTIKVTVSQKLPFGIICDICENVNGLLHQSEFSWNPNDNLMNNVKIGDELELAIIKIDVKNNKVSLSRKALIDNPWNRVEANIGDKVECVITEVTSKGLKVETLGVDGFIDIRDIRLEKNSSKLSDYFNEGDKVIGYITKLDSRSWILEISLKAYQEDMERIQFEEFMSQQKEEEPVTTLGDIFKDIL